MTSAFCPNCGTPRVGALRYCESCRFDFDAPRSPAPDPASVSSVQATGGAKPVLDNLAGTRAAPGLLRSGPFRFALVGVGILVVLNALALLAGVAAYPPATLAFGIVIWFFILWGAAVAVTRIRS